MTSLGPCRENKPFISNGVQSEFVENYLDNIPEHTSTVLKAFRFGREEDYQGSNVASQPAES